MKSREIDLGYVLIQKNAPYTTLRQFAKNLSGEPGTFDFGNEMLVGPVPLHMIEKKSELKLNLERAVRIIANRVGPETEIIAQKLSARIEYLAINQEDIEKYEAKSQLNLLARRYKNHHASYDKAILELSELPLDKDPRQEYLESLAEKVPDIHEDFVNASSKGDLYAVLPVIKQGNGFKTSEGALLSKGKLREMLTEQRSASRAHFNLDQFKDVILENENKPVYLAKIMLDLKGPEIKASSLLSQAEMAQAEVEGTIEQASNPELQQSYELLKNM